jgi:hypothetical protein
MSAVAMVTVAALDLLAVVCRVEGGENVTDLNLIGCDLVELFALVCLYPAKFARGLTSTLAAAVEVDLRGTR